MTSAGTLGPRTPLPAVDGATAEAPTPNPADNARERRSPAERIDAFGPLLLALFYLATARWGSYIAPGPPYIGDIVLGALIVNRTLLIASRRWTAGSTTRDASIAILGAALFVWSAFRLGFGPMNVDAARDAAPYLYVVLVFLIVPLDGRQAQLAGRLAMWSLAFHAAWLTPTVLLGDAAITIDLPWAPGERVAIFAKGATVSTFACGLLSCLALHRALSGRSPSVNLGIAAWAFMLAVFGLNARGALIAVGIQLLILIALGPARKRLRAEATARAPRSERMRAAHNAGLALAALILIAPLGLYMARDTTTVQALPLAFSPNADHRFPISNGAETARARLRTWDHLVTWTLDDPGRTIAGVGFGPNYLADTGASLLLGVADSDDLRAPHSHPVNSLARLGMVGLLLVLALWVASIRLATLVAARSARLRDIDVLAILVALTLPVAASVGVLLESPFGAIPYYWSLGHLAVRAHQLGATRGLRDALGHSRDRHRVATIAIPAATATIPRSAGR